MTKAMRCERPEVASHATKLGPLSGPEIPKAS